LSGELQRALSFVDTSLVSIAEQYEPRELHQGANVHLVSPQSPPQSQTALVRSSQDGAKTLRLFMLRAKSPLLMDLLRSRDTLKYAVCQHTEPRDCHVFLHIYQLLERDAAASFAVLSNLA
jgi:hypothetical protein